MKKFLILFCATATLFAASCTKDNTTPAGTTPPTGAAVKTSTLTMKVAWTKTTTSNAKCFADLDAGVVYDVTTAPAHAADIDVFWAARPTYQDGYFVSPDDSYPLIGSGGMAYSTDLKVTSWSQQNHTTFDGGNKITPAGFDAVQTVDQLRAEWNKAQPYITYIPFQASAGDLEKIYTFETAQHKRGLIHVTAGTFGSAGTATPQIKIEP